MLVEKDERLLTFDKRIRRARDVMEYYFNVESRVDDEIMFRGCVLTFARRKDFYSQ